MPNVIELDRERMAAEARAAGVPMTRADLDAVARLVASGVRVEDVTEVIGTMWFRIPGLPSYSLRALCVAWPALQEALEKRRRTPRRPAQLALRLEGDGIEIRPSDDMPPSR